jgi:hypothetical protein
MWWCLLYLRHKLHILTLRNFPPHTEQSLKFKLLRSPKIDSKKPIPSPIDCLKLPAQDTLRKWSKQTQMFVKLNTNCILIDVFLLKV